MEKDVGWKGFFSNDERYADIINGLGCSGRQVVKEEDLQELDTQTGFLHGTNSMRSRQPLSVGRLGRIAVD